MKAIQKNKWLLCSILLLFIFSIGSTKIYATTPVPSVQIDIGTADTPQEFSETLMILFLLTIIGLAPSILIMMTSFTRIVITLNFLKTALGTPQMPPNQILIGLALFITFFIMSPVLTQMNETALIPYQEGQITQSEAIENAIIPIKEFMLRQTRDEDITLFMDLANRPLLEEGADLVQEIPMHILMPSFIISEIRAGFIIGFLIYIPFIVIDMVVASTLMAMGMMMMPPATIALPFKIMLFIFVDGWNLLVGQLIQTFR